MFSIRFIFFEKKTENVEFIYGKTFISQALKGEFCIAKINILPLIFSEREKNNKLFSAIMEGD